MRALGVGGAGTTEEDPSNAALEQMPWLLCMTHIYKCEHWEPLGAGHFLYGDADPDANREGPGRDINDREAELPVMPRAVQHIAEVKALL